MPVRDVPLALTSMASMPASAISRLVSMKSCVVSPPGYSSVELIFIVMRKSGLVLLRMSFRIS